MPLCRKFDAHTLLGKTTLKERLRLVAGTFPTCVRSRTSIIRYLVIPDSAWSQIICIEGHPATSTNHEFQMNFTDEAYHETRKPAVAVSQSLALQLPPLSSLRNGVYQKSPASDGPSTYFPWKKSSTSWFMLHWKSWKYVNIAIFCHILWDFYGYPGYPFRHRNFPITASHGIPWRRFPAMGAPSRGSFRSCFVIAGPCFLSLDWFSHGLFTKKKRLYIWLQKPWFIMVSCWFIFPWIFRKKICWSWIEGKKGHQKG